MRSKDTFVVDANQAAADVAYRTSEVVAIYPITPASPMGEHADAWAAQQKTNVWGGVPTVVEMQSEAGAAGALHGSLQAGAVTTTFTASQGLLLMLPDMFKVAGELTAGVIHVAARSVATHALSIFCDHSDIYAARGTGFAMMASSTGQEAHDLALVALVASLQTRIPFLHFFDGFRTSHELGPVARLSDEDLVALLPQTEVVAHRERGLSPEHPVVRGTAQNPDVFFQARESINPFYDRAPATIQAALDAFAARTGRAYRLFEYTGDPEAERVVVVMGSAAETAAETVQWLREKGERVGVLKVRLLRPWSAEHMLAALPATVKSLAVLDRTKEPGATGEPLFLDVLASMHGPDAAGRTPARVVGGRYGLSSKEFTPAMVKAVFDGLADGTLRHGFTVGIRDDVTGRSIPYDTTLDIEPDDTVRAVFFGLGSDGTVGANKNSIKIIGEDTDRYAQGFFVYDSKKSGAVTVSHLRFGPRPIHSAYLIRSASFVACHGWHLLSQRDVLGVAGHGATLLLNAPYAADEVWDKLPRDLQQTILDKELNVWCIDAHDVASQAGLGRRINTVMQVCFFALAGVLPREEAIARIKSKIEQTYARKGEEIVRLNLAAVDAALDHLHEVPIGGAVTSTRVRPAAVPAHAPEFVQRVTSIILGGHGDELPVSAFVPDGTWPVGTSRFEKRNIALEIPVWDPDICIQCNKCAIICPHAAVRVKVYDPALAEGAPPTFQHMPYKAKEFADAAYTVQVAPEDCTGCGVCVEFCPAKDKSNPRHKALDMAPQRPLREAESLNWEFFHGLPDAPREQVTDNVKGSQFLAPLFEFSGACSGCGETPYIKLMTQLFGDRAVIANATGCSSIYGGNLPTTPYCTNADGRGPAWSNSLFEDNAEFGLGMRLALDQHAEHARRLVREMASEIGGELADALVWAEMGDEAGIAAQRERVELLRARLGDDEKSQRLAGLADYLVKKSLWIVGGDGWAYDIGYGGLDHVLASGHDVNVLVLDTEVYSNTGGQASKATPLGAVAKFAAQGKGRPKKDLGLLAMMYGDIFVAQVALGAKDAQTYKAFVDAESWPGPSLIIAYSPCIAHGYDLRHMVAHQKLAVETGYWPLFSFDPRRVEAGQPGLKLDTKKTKAKVARYMETETRFRMLAHTQPERAAALTRQAQEVIDARMASLLEMANSHQGER